MSELTGTTTLLGVALRRSRVALGAGVGVLTVLAAFSAVAVVDLYPTTASRVEAAAGLNNSQSTVAMFGRIYDPTSTGAIALIKMGSLGAVAVAMLSVVLMVRHTRTDEEAGRTELVGATAIGRLAPLGAAWVLVVMANVVLALATGIGLTAAGLDIGGSFAFGVAWGSVGLAFGAIAAVTAQITASSRTAISLAATVLGLVYVLRAIGDTASAGGPQWLTWMSPIGWGQQFRPYAGNRWWVLGIVLAFTVVVLAVAVVLRSHRDIGAGLIAPRPGPVVAAASLASPLALAWRLQRVALAGWAVSFLLLGALLGNMATNIGDLLNSPSAQDYITKLGGEQGLTDAFLAAELGIAAVIASAYGIQAALRLRSEEAGELAEPLLATGVGRVRWAMSHITIAVAGTTMLMVLVGLGAGVAHAIQISDAGQVTRLLLASLAPLPAVWVAVSIVVVAFGFVPRFATFGWAALAFFVVLGELGPLVDLSQTVMDLSPFAHVPKLPGGTFTPTSLLVLTAIAVLGTIVGLAAFRRRDIPAT